MSYRVNGRENGNYYILGHKMFIANPLGPRLNGGGGL